MQMSIKYLYSNATNLEIVLSKQTGQSYPWHIHVEHTVVGVLLAGKARLGLAKGPNNCPKTCMPNGPAIFPNAQHIHTVQQGQYFIVPAGQKHCLKLEPCSYLATICLHAAKSPDARLQDFDYAFSKLDLPPNLQGLKAEIAQKLKVSNLPPSQQSPSVQVQGGLQGLQSLLHAHPQNNLNLATMAALAGYSPWHFLRIFRKEIGLTPHAYLLSCKLNLARRLLRKQPDDIAGAAVGAGFYDQSHMHKLFKAQHGLTPGEFLKASQKLKHQT